MSIPRKNPRLTPRSNSRSFKPEMHRTTCDVCHKPCEVPFVPNGKKPVFCDACFNKTRDTAPTTDYVRRKDKTVFDLPVDHIPSAVGQAPVQAYAQSEAKFAELKRELTGVNAKLDKLIDLMSKLRPAKVAKKEEKEVEAN